MEIKFIKGEDVSRENAPYLKKELDDQGFNAYNMTDHVVVVASQDDLLSISEALDNFHDGVEANDRREKEENN